MDDVSKFLISSLLTNIHYDIHDYLFLISNVINRFMDEWSSSLSHGSVYAFLEPQSLHNAKDKRGECRQYIETWLKESQ